MSEKKGLIAEFKEFIARGNVMDLAVGVIIGGAFNGIVSSLCDDVIMPAIQLLVGTVAGDKYVNPETGAPDFEMMTKALNVGTIKFGSFLSAIINFLIMAIIIFAIVKAFNKMMEIGKKPAEEPAEEPVIKECPFCMTEIPIKATRCPHCTSQLEEDKKVTVDKKKK
ncbi:MAG: large conductance mechanosensitive channel protein MscL [Clostridia bacterium]|nr:large conductance mechanosensitive channel protein MscL [Clostridia bacterium]